MGRLTIGPTKKPPTKKPGKPLGYVRFSRTGIFSPKKKRIPGWLVALIDFLLVGLAICVFAFFHHVIPWKANNPGVEISRPPLQSQTEESADSSSEENEESQVPDPMQGMWGEKFADKFSDTLIKTENSYISKDIHVELTKHVLNEGTKNQVTYYLADIYIRNIDNFRTAFAGGEFGRGLRDNTVKMAQENNAVIALSGDYYGIRDTGVVIRNGRLYRDSVFRDVCVLFSDGTMETYSADEFNLYKDSIIDNSPYQAWSFGPRLLDANGQVMQEFDTDVRPANPRSAIGYIEPGHYIFLAVDGRQDGYSVGLRLEAMSQLFYDLGCKAAYNLDGGQSAVMAFDGELANQPVSGGRNISDILYIGEVE